MFPTVVFVFLLQSTGSILCEHTTSDEDIEFRQPSKFDLF